MNSRDSPRDTDHQPGATGQGATVIRIEPDNSGGATTSSQLGIMDAQRSNILSLFTRTSPTTLHAPDDIVYNNSAPTIQDGNGGGAASTSQSGHAAGRSSWRMNLNDMFSAHSREALRTLILQSNSFRYTPLSTNENSATVSGDNNIPFLLQPDTPRNSGENVVTTTTTTAAPNLRTNAGSSFPENDAYASRLTEMWRQAAVESGRENVVERTPRENTNRNETPPADMDDDTNVISNGLVKLIGLLAKYLPFICILFVKCIHDHLLGILDLLLLHAIMYQINKSLREQIAKFSQKSYMILLRDLGLVASVVTCRILLASSAPDPFGLLITPPVESVSAKIFEEPISMPANEQSATSMIAGWAQPTASTTPAANALIVTKAVSLGVLLYYVAVNDLILKLLTILVKIMITMLPTKVIRHKPRAHMFVLVEYLSQFYRACVPVRHWLIFLFESYSGLEVISGVLFSSFYMGAKSFEFVERGKSLHKALVNFVRNTDHERKPTKEELESAGSPCPICHDGYSTPVILECGHIFCDDCVSTWFKREQTCPLCRAKVSDDPSWKDGSTSFFYQFC